MNRILFVDDEINVLNAIRQPGLNISRISGQDHRSDRCRYIEQTGG
jgi:hypothetical protein